MGGYIVIGAKQATKSGPWSLPGITPPGADAAVWIEQAIDGLNPAPRHESRSWVLSDGRLVAVAWVDPVDEAPCMTRRGQVYERVSGRTVPVEDPARLDALFRRGRHARERAEQFAERAALRALTVPEWRSIRAVGISVGLAPIGRETDDVSSRLFVPSFRDALLQAIGRYYTGGQGVFGQFATTDYVEMRLQQDALVVLARSSEDHDLHPTGVAGRRPRTEWMLQATWDGAVAASVMLTPDAVERPVMFADVIVAGWREIERLVQLLGGYGPARLVVAIDVAKPPPRDGVIVESGVAFAAPPPPPQNTLYARLGEHTRMSRAVTVAEPDPEVLASLQRELERASGGQAWEPEDEQRADA